MMPTLQVCVYFNPRSLTGATGLSRLTITTSAFQSTLPYGSDLKLITSTAQEKISIHAPLRERPLIKPIIQPCSVFQSTLPYGSDIANVLKPRRKSYFNPRSLTGATLQQSLLVPCRVKFQSTLPYGSDVLKKVLLR